MEQEVKSKAKDHLTIDEVKLALNELSIVRHNFVQEKARSNPIKYILSDNNTYDLSYMEEISEQKRIPIIDKTTVTFIYDGTVLIPISLKRDKEGKLISNKDISLEDKIKVPLTYLYWFGFEEHIIEALYKLNDIDENNSKQDINIRIDLGKRFNNARVCQYYVNYVACPQDVRVVISITNDGDKCSKSLISLIENMCLLYTYYLDEVYNTEDSDKRKFFEYTLEKIINDICVNIKNFVYGSIEYKWDPRKSRHILNYVLSRLKDCVAFTEKQINEYTLRNSADTRWAVKNEEKKEG
jgi:hypothetical protein